MNNSATQSPLGAFLQDHGMTPLVNEPLRNHCTWRIGGPADFFVEPSSWQQVAAVLRYANANNIPAIVIGKGSNLLFDDAGLRGVVIKIGRGLSRLTVTGTIVRAESGISTPRLARAVGLAGLTGLEHIIGIPGTLGGLVFMNGGSMRKAIGDSIVEIKAMDWQGHMRVFRREECEFAYRHSRFQSEDCVIIEATIELAGGSRNATVAEMLRILRDRRRKFPLTLPNCGSVFKSDPQLYDTFGPPGEVLEYLGLKGLRVGGAMVDTKHANFIVNMDNARASDVRSLVGLIRHEVRQRIGLAVKCEVQFVASQGVVRDI